ncbi:hypothetical protein FJQ98_20530 [Lysinibacillus agricola]|uniref:Uncharacterized protein n=1 Tax=Lysinibacillus agricola TaxID=2590012 RepID=A0ABX7ANQ6_9BACI|nr:MULTISPECIES: hypothetical protein [Lysinibacillus]KOS60890.1 hypothetical protein AN161_20125 [Lysinibacillus sp. FJAT-14222]QQP11558.1 hypothetical protein FJQ98_20530 [Lysinibacillus agricola]
MKEVITLIIFTVPGLLTYFWINLFGITPTTKRENSEVVAISILLWIPIVSVVLTIYNSLALMSRWTVIQPNFDFPLLKKDWMYVDNLESLIKLSGSVWFILFYISITIVVSFYLAKFISKNAYKKMLDKINEVREKNNIAPLNVHTTVWDSTFLNNEGQIIEFKKYGESTSMIGLLIKVPRAHESGKSIVLEAVDHWTKIMEYYDVQIDQTYVDIDNGIVINIYNLNSALEAQDLFNDRFPNGLTS